MDKNKSIKKAFLLIIMEIILIISLLIIYTKPIFADSGFDTSYDSYTSSDSYSSYDDYDSYDRYDDYDRYGRYDRYDRYDRYNRYDDDGYSLSSLILFVVIAVVVSGIRFFRGTSNSNKLKTKSFENNNQRNNNNIAVEKRIKEYIPDFNEEDFLSESYKTYLEVQNAWMNFKIEDVKDVLSRELYSKYSSQLTELQIKREKNIMEGFNLINGSLKDVIVANDIITIKVMFVIEFYDYVIVETTRDVLRGSDDQKIRVTYELDFRKSLKPNNITKCPGCGADISRNTTGICEYCRTKLETGNSKWILCDKKNVTQDFV